MALWLCDFSETVEQDIKIKHTLRNIMGAFLYAENFNLKLNFHWF